LTREVANVDARINVTANTTQAERELARLQDRLGAIERAANIPVADIIRTGSIQRSIQTINRLEQAIVSLRSNLRSINAPGGGSIGDSIRQAATASNQFFDSLASGQRSLSNTIAGLREQSNAFASLASSINSADARFTDYIQGAQSAQDKGLRPLFRQFEALRQLYEQGITGRGVEITSGDMGADLFERLAREVPQTEAALKAFSAELTRIRSLIGSESAAAFGVEQEIIRIEQALLQIEQDRLEVRSAINREMSAPVQSALSRMEGRRADPFGVSDEQANETLNQRAEQYARQQEELSSLQGVLASMQGKKYDPLNISDEQINSGLNERAVQYERQVSELSDLQRVLSSMEGKKYDPLGISDEQINSGLNQRAAAYEQQTRELSGLQQALGSMEQKRVNWATALGINETDIAAQRAAELAVEWSRLQAAADGIAAQAPQTAAALKQFEFQTRAQDAEAYTRALLNQQRTLDEYTDSANRAANAAKGLGYGGEFPALRPAGSTDQDVRIKNLLDDQTQAARIVADLEVDLGKMVNNLELENIQRQMVAEIDSIEAILARRKAADEEWWKGAKAKLDEKARLEKEQAKKSSLPFLEQRFGKRGSAAISEGLIGGAFPLLFGQGLGASVLGGAGGALGGFAGGGLGFGLSLIGTAAGTAFDTAVQSATELGAALTDTSKSFETVKERSLFSSKEAEKLASRLEEYGLVASASAAAQQEIINKIGGTGVESLTRLGDSSDKLARAWSELNLQLQSALAGPMAGLVDWVAEVVGVANKRGRTEAEIQDIFAGLPPEKQTSFLDRFQSDIQSIFNSLGPAVLSAGSAFGGPLQLDPSFKADIVTTKQKIANEFKDQVVAIPGKIKLSEKQVREEVINIYSMQAAAISGQLEAIDAFKNVSNAAKQARRQQEDVDRQAADIRKGYEEQIADIRLNLERTIQQQAIENIRTQNQLYEAQGEIRLQGIRNATAELVSAQRGDEFGERLSAIFGEISELQLSTEQEIENRKRQFETDLLARSIETEIAKADIAKQVAKLNEDTQRRIFDINRSIRVQNEEYDQRRFELERRLAGIKLKTAAEELQNNLLVTKNAINQLRTSEQTPDVAKRLQLQVNLLKLLEDQKDVLADALTEIATPLRIQKTTQVSGPALQSVSTAAYDNVRASAMALTRALFEANEQVASLVKQGQWIKIKDQLIELADQGFTEARRSVSEFVADFRGANLQIEELEKKIDSAKRSLSIGGADEYGISIQKRLGISSQQLKGLLQLQILSAELAKEQAKGAETANYLVNASNNLDQEYSQLVESLKELTFFGSEYERQLQDLVAKGLDPAAESSQVLLEKAASIDILREKVAVVEGFTFAADALSESMRGLVSRFAEFGSASEAVKEVTKEFGQKSFDFILDIAFRPIEDAMRKSALDMAKLLGFDISTPAEQQLTNLQQINTNVASILGSLNSLVGKLAQMQPAPAVATPSAARATSLMTQSGPRTPEELALRDMTSYAEGTWQSAKGIPGYDVRFGGGRFNTGAHPGQGAAGAYQFIPGTWNMLGGGAMDPAVQDSRFFELVKRRNVDARQMINPQMIDKLAPEWASFPTMQGRSYWGQPFKPYQDLEKFYKERLEFYRNTVPAAAPQQQAAPAGRPYQVGDWIGPQSSMPSSTFDGIGGPDLPGKITSIQVIENEANQLMNGVAGSVKDISNKTAQEVKNLQTTVVPEWGQALGKVVTGLGAATSAVISIIGGIEMIKEGGASNILGGIGSILTTAGSVVGMFGGFGGAKPMSANGFFNPLTGKGVAGPNFGFADGGIFGPSGLEMFADGAAFANSIISSPTLFQFADGGALNTGVMGEAGPEAIMPLERGPDGRLGVRASLTVPFEGSSVMPDQELEPGSEQSDTTRMRRMAAAAASLRVPFAKGVGAATASSDGGTFAPGTTASSAGSPSASVDTVIRFESTVINGVEFVTRQEAEQIGRTAAARGADLAQRRLKNNPQARRSIGI
jgi:hypothetical protein